MLIVYKLWCDAVGRIHWIQQLIISEIAGVTVHTEDSQPE